MNERTSVTRSQDQRPQDQRPQEQRSGEQASRREPALVPAVNVHEDGAGITLYADLPGVSRDRLTIEVDGDSLSIEGEVALELPEGLEPTYAEVSRPRYRRVFTLSKELDAGKVSASLNQGVLKLRIPKAEHAKPRKVEVSVS